MDDDLILVAGAQAVSGWTDVHVTRGIERCPSDFSLGLTEAYPGETEEVVVQAGDPFQLMIGQDRIITGYIDDYVPEYDADSHSISATGRGKCQDLVDCSAVWPNGQISGTSALDVASKLAAHYGINVTCDIENLPPIPQFNLFIGESAYDIIERISRYSQLLVYEDPYGDLLLTQAHQTMHVGGVAEGVNVQHARVRYSASQRFSKYTVFTQSVETFTDAGIGANVIVSVEDVGVQRTRERFIVAEAVQGYEDLANRRAVWEMNRRIARAAEIVVTTDGWRDGGGTLWTPNTLIPVTLPKLKIVNEVWLLGEVTYIRNEEEGTIAELTIMRPEAYLPEPVALQPMFVDASALPGAR
ncbi:phage baseplate assembly protein [Trinickia dinghuensis]|uniref:Mu P family protein n=1 Tax=Trinickia dinghuensis TaxID=2291023 RepID=A0A3D8K2W3_9BURK|nr:Mu P family protein [Trinickia dinghuensis]RDU99236.1 Mu P family protein [Trinickia dinghuensis]